MTSILNLEEVKKITGKNCFSAENGRQHSDSLSLEGVRWPRLLCRVVISKLDFVSCKALRSVELLTQKSPKWMQ